jgi:hypothetical protein
VIQRVQALSHRDELWRMTFHPRNADLLFPIPRLDGLPEPLAQAFGSAERQPLEAVATLPRRELPPGFSRATPIRWPLNLFNIDGYSGNDQLTGRSVLCGVPRSDPEQNPFIPASRGSLVKLRDICASRFSAESRRRARPACPSARSSGGGSAPAGGAGSCCAGTRSSARAPTGWRAIHRKQGKLSKSVRQDDS